MEMTYGEKQYGAPLNLACWTCFQVLHEVETSSFATKATNAICRVESNIGNIEIRGLLVPDQRTNARLEGRMTELCAHKSGRDFDYVCSCK